MFKSDELIHILLAVLIISFVIGLAINSFLTAVVFAIIILFANILAKKAMAYFLDCGIKIKIWYMQRYGIYERSKFKYPVPMGVILPFIISILSIGQIVWLAVTEFEIYPLKSRASKKIGLYRFSELTESHINQIASCGIVANLALAILAYLYGSPSLARYSIYFASFNMLPISNLDGSKIFFGGRKIWLILAILILIALAYSFVLV